MNQVVSDAYDVTRALFGPESGIPWWAWVFVVAALFWKIVIPQPKTTEETVEEHERAMVAEIIQGSGKKGKKGKKSKK